MIVDCNYDIVTQPLYISIYKYYYMVKKSTDNKGQRSQVCNARGCTEQGRILAHLGGTPISYCPKHRKKYGERIVNALINSLFNFKLTNFLQIVKLDLFQRNDFFCVECSEKLREYVINKTNELEDLLEFQDKNEAKAEDIK